MKTNDQVVAAGHSAGPDRWQEAFEDLTGRIAGSRWRVEETFQSGKGLAGLDERQVRRYASWSRLVTLSMLAHAFRAVVRADERTYPATADQLIPLTVRYPLQTGDAARPGRRIAGTRTLSSVIPYGCIQAITRRPREEGAANPGNDSTPQAAGQ